MTREEAIVVLKGLMKNPLFSEVHKVAFNIAIHDIKAYHKWNLNELVLTQKDNEQEPILDKLRVEILEEKEHAYADFERYKVEYLGQDWEDALDSLPQDDFRYGMERAIELIDKYKAETEVGDGNDD